MTLSRYDDRVEAPQGVTPQVILGGHHIGEGLGNTWPRLLGYNRVIPKPSAEIIATVGEDVLIAAGSYGKGRSVAFTSDCGPHWAPPGFVEWEGYARLWDQIVSWTTGRP